MSLMLSTKRAKMFEDWNQKDKTVRQCGTLTGRFSFHSWCRFQISIEILGKVLFKPVQSLKRHLVLNIWFYTGHFHNLKKELSMIIRYLPPFRGLSIHEHVLVSILSRHVLSLVLKLNFWLFSFSKWHWYMQIIYLKTNLTVNSRPRVSRKTGENS